MAGLEGISKNSADTQGGVLSVGGGNLLQGFGEVRQGVTHPTSRLAMLLPFPWTAEQWAGGENSSSRDGKADLLAMAFLEFRLVIEGITLAGSAEHKKLNDRFGADRGFDVRGESRFVSQK